MKSIVFVTGNKFKVMSAQYVLDKYGTGIKVIGKKIDCPEIQADTIEEVAKFSSKYASDQLRTTVLKNDTGIIIPALDNFPGPYTKYVAETIGADGIIKLMSGITNRSAVFVECNALTEYGKEPIVFFSRTEGTISDKIDGEYGTEWDKIFIPKGQTRTLANFKDVERVKMWDEKGMIDFAQYIKSKTKEEREL